MLLKVSTVGGGLVGTAMPSLPQTRHRHGDWSMMLKVGLQPVVKVSAIRQATIALNGEVVLSRLATNEAGIPNPDPARSGA